MKKIQRELRREFDFAEITTTNGGHLRIVLPNGRSVFAAATPSCRRWLRNLHRDVRRAMAATGKDR